MGFRGSRVQIPPSRFGVTEGPGVERRGREHRHSWSSGFSDPQWIYVDLGATHTISKVVLNWEAAYGKAYQIQTSNDATTWTTIYSTTTSTGGSPDAERLRQRALRAYVRDAASHAIRLFAVGVPGLRHVGPWSWVVGDGRRPGRMLRPSAFATFGLALFTISRGHRLGPVQSWLARVVTDERMETIAGGQLSRSETRELATFGDQV